MNEGYFDPLRFLVTAYADLDVAVDALNSGLLYSYLSKSWDPDDLEHRMIKAQQTCDGRNAIEIALPQSPPSEERVQRSRQVLNQLAEFDPAVVTSGMGLPA